MILPGRMWVAGAENYRFGFNGKENVDEIAGNNNNLDFGSRIYDGRLGRWLSIDKLAYKHPFESPYVFASNSPLIFIDPDGKEKIVISGGKDMRSKKDGMKFINAGIAAIQEYKANRPTAGPGSLENITWIVTAADYSNEEWETIQKVATEQGVKVLLISSADEIVNYVNSKNLDDSGLSDARSSDQITEISVFSHGWSGTAGLAYGNSDPSYTLDVTTRIKGEVIEQMDKGALSENAQFDYYSCNSAGEEGYLNLAQKTVSLLEIKTTGFEGSSSYYGLYDNGAVKDKNGIVTSGKVNLPNTNGLEGGSKVISYDSSN